MGAPEWDFAVPSIIVTQRPAPRFPFNTIKKAIVTGRGGIGRAIARMPLEEGAEAAIGGRSEESGAGAMKKLEKHAGRRAGGRACKVWNLVQLRKFFPYVDDTLISLDILFNHAWSGAFGSGAEMGAEQRRARLETSPASVFHFYPLAMERFRRVEGGFVVNLSSLAGKNAFPGRAAYNASKSWLNGFSEALMLDHRAGNARVEAILEGRDSTGFSASGGGGWKTQAPSMSLKAVRMVMEVPDRARAGGVEMRPSKPAKRLD